MTKNIKLSNIKIVGFGSFCNEVDFNLDRGGITLIKGENGVGKTTLVSALAWVLYKINLKDLANGKVVTWNRNRPKTFKGTRVMAEFHVEGFDYLIARHINYKEETVGLKGDSSLMLFKKLTGEPVFEQAHMVADELFKSDQQGYINKLIGINADTFLKAVLFGQKMKRLIESEDTDKRELFETLFDIDFIKLARDNAKAKYENESTKKSDYLLKRGERLSRSEAINNKIEYNNTILKTFEDNRNTQLVDLNYLLSECMNSLEAIKKDKDLFIEKIAAFGPIEDNLVVHRKSLERSTNVYNECVNAYNKMYVEAQTARLKQYDDYIQACTADKLSNEAKITGITQVSMAKVTNDIRYKESELERAIPALRAQHFKRYDDKLIDVDTQLLALDNNIRSLNDLYQDCNHKLQRYDFDIRSKQDREALLMQQLKDADKKCPKCGSSIMTIEELAVLTMSANEELAAIVIALPALKQYRAEIEVKRQATEKDCENKVVYKGQADNQKIILLQARKQAEMQFSVGAMPEVVQAKADIEADKRSLVCLQDEVDAIKIILSQINQSIEQSKADRQKEVDNMPFYLSSLPYLLQKNEEVKTESATISGLKQSILNIEKILIDKTELSRQLSVCEERLRMTHQNYDDMVARKQLIVDQKKPEVDTEALQVEGNNIFIEVCEIDGALQAIDKRTSYLKGWIDKGFGVSGVKSYVFDSGLRALNEAMLKYSSRLGVRLEFSVDMDKANRPFITSCYKGGESIEYAELSGGQQARVNVATAFAMHDVVSAMSNINVLVLDEVFEGLDAGGIETVFDLIRVKAGDVGRSVYVITHSAYVDTLNTKSIDIEADDKGNSYIC